jgi:hypothetical protein
VFTQSNGSASTNATARETDSVYPGVAGASKQEYRLPCKQQSTNRSGYSLETVLTLVESRDCASRTNASASKQWLL